MIYFVTAIGTDSGKTLASSIITEFLQADYWKPVQSGNPRDTETVKSLITNTNSNFYKEKYLLNTPASPHASAKTDGVQIDLNSIVPPITNRDLVVEGAGGVLVPLNDRDNVIDIAEKFGAIIILVSNLYLGSINHTLLTVEYLKKRNLKVKGIIFNGESNPESERIILLRSGFKKLLHIKKEQEITKEVVQKYAKELSMNWNA